MDPAAFDRMVMVLRGPEVPRVWSLLVTVFGDLALDGAPISTGLLGHLVAPLGVRREAMRVALHRLRKDGWLDSTRMGRSSSHALTAQGRRESAAAKPVIYAGGPPAETAWLVISDPDSDLPLHAEVRVAAHTGVTGEPPTDAEVMAWPLGAEDPVPDWVRARVCDPPTLSAAALLAKRLADLETALADTAPPTPLQATVLRVLIVHEWRRIVLKLPRLPDHVFPTGWAGPRCRASVARLLTALPRRTPACLEEAAARAAVGQDKRAAP